MTTLRYIAKVRDDNILPKATPNGKMLAFLRLIENSHQARPETDGSNTQRLINEARGGAMYGYEHL